MTFSERHGYKVAKDTIQIESMDLSLRNGLWSLLKIHCWDNVRYSSTGRYIGENTNKEMFALCQSLWFSYFKKPLDELGMQWSNVYKEIRAYFFACKWFEVYDFIEFIINNYKKYSFKENFTQACNRLLEKEMSGYRLIKDVVSPITSEQEIESIERIIGKNNPVHTHMKRALDLLSDRKIPDYRNSIKESISAVESNVGRILADDKGTLGQLLKKLKDDSELHPALIDAFSKLYGYTSDESGIRHSLMDKEKCGFEEAKFMLVVCSAFINYVDGLNISA